jgi:hypothetical protein
MTADGSPVKNRALIQYVATLLDARAQRGQQIRLVYVKGHSGDTGNDGADFLACQGVTYPPAPERDWEQLLEDFEDLEIAKTELQGKRPAMRPMEVEVEDMGKVTRAPLAGPSRTYEKPVRVPVRKVVSERDIDFSVRPIQSLIHHG